MESESRVSRRGFLKKTGMAVVGGGVVAGGSAAEAAGEEGRSEGRQEVRVQEYRTLGRTGFQVSDISFGTGNLSNANVLRVALDMGMNYIDTAEHYVNGQAERTVGEVMGDRDRSSIFLTTKLNLTLFGGSTKEELIDRFRRCLERMRTDYADCLMIHMTPRAEEVKHEPYHEAIAELKAEGKVRFSGLSNHGIQHSVFGPTEDTMESVIGAAVEDGRFDVALFTYNFLQREQGERVIELCRSKDMGVTLMKTNPVGNGANLAARVEEMRRSGRTIPPSTQRIVDEYQAFVEAADEFKERHGLQSNTQVRDAAIKFTLSNPGVHTACPTMNSFDELEAFVALSGQRLTSPEDSMLASYDELLGRYYCRHACGICEPSCPQNVPVNTVMRYGHYFDAQGREKQAMQKYAALPQTNASVCRDCPGHCERACPYGVPAQLLLSGVHRNLTMA